jgi:hypothetical protein
VETPRYQPIIPYTDPYIMSGGQPYGGAAKLKEPNTAAIKSEDVVERAEKAAALALVY